MEVMTLGHGGNFLSVTGEHVFAVCDRCNKQCLQWVVMGDIHILMHVWHIFHLLDQWKLIITTLTARLQHARHPHECWQGRFLSYTPNVCSLHNVLLIDVQMRLNHLDSTWSKRGSGNSSTRLLLESVISCHCAPLISSHLKALSPSWMHTASWWRTSW